MSTKIAGKKCFSYAEIVNTLGEQEKGENQLKGSLMIWLKSRLVILSCVFSASRQGRYQYRPVKLHPEQGWDLLPGCQWRRHSNRYH